MWDVEPETYPEIAEDVDAFVAHVVKQTRSGSIVLMHVMYESGAISREALPRIVTGLRERGFEFVTASELLEKRGQTPNSDCQTHPFFWKAVSPL
ncbi:hypothetical protein [Mesorhizobium sp. YR577]|uniref:hypothetical protein n=1 Tax=Mesorhizobium sp. YR577 TaxID=1884373 RepID=UPI0015873D0A|nr:hypothetical protein [Mesorhizobium sp. YR577]